MNWKCSEKDCEFEGKNMQSLTLHKTRKHRKLGGNTGKTTTAPTKAVVVHRPPRIKAQVNGWKELEGFTLLEDGNGGIWIAERIK